MKSYRLLLLILTAFFLPSLLYPQVDNASVRSYNGPGNGWDRALAIAGNTATVPSRLQPAKGTQEAILKAKQAYNKNYVPYKPEIKPHTPSPTDATITCYPNPANYETGSCLHSGRIHARTQKSLVWASNQGDSTIDRGWMVFNTEGIPDGSLINSIELHAYCYNYYWPYWAITRITRTDPRTSPVASVYSDLSFYDADGYYLEFFSDPAPGWNVFTMPAYACTDLQSNLVNDWWAVGFHDWDDFYVYYCDWEGWAETNVPYIVVNYSASTIYNVGTRRIVSPIGLVPAGLTTVQAMVKNYCIWTAYQFDVRFTIGSYTDVQTVPRLTPGDSVLVTFADWNATSGVYTAKCSTEDVWDEDNSNDKKEVLVSAPDFFEDFEASNGGYTPDPATNGWEWGTPTVGPMSAHSGVNCWGTRLNGNYDNNASWRLVSNELKATADNPTINYYDWWYTEAYYDGYQVAYSTDEGITWNLLTPVSGYNYSSVVGLGNTPGYSGSQPSWQLKTVVVPVTNNTVFRFRWRFGSDDSVNSYPGVFIDDVAGASCIPFIPANDVGCIKILAPTGVIDSGTVVTPACSVYNYGTTTESYPVRMKIGIFYNEIDSIIAYMPGTYRYVQFPSWNANQPGFYMVSCSTELYADERTSNDKRTDSVTVIAPIAIKMEKELNSIKTFSLQIIPNPTNNLVHISYTLPVKTEAKLKLYDVIGNLVYQAESDNGLFAINTERLSIGIYIVKFEAGDYKAIEKLIVTR